MSYITYTEPLAQLIKRHNPKRGLEVGLWKGISAETFLNNCSGTLTSVDLNNAYDSETTLQSKYPDRLTVILGNSPIVLGGLKEKFDYIYIDGDHTYEGCLADIKAAIPLLEKGGVIVIDDYGIKQGSVFKNGEDSLGDYGVELAVEEALSGWKRIDEDIPLANGAVVFQCA